MTVWRIPTLVIELFITTPEIWDWPVFRQRVGLSGVPWADGNVPEEWAANDGELLEKVRAFLEHMKSVKGREERRVSFEAKSKANPHEDGRDALQKYFSTMCRLEWKIKEAFLRAMEDNGLTPLNIVNSEQLDAVSETHFSRAYS